METKTETKTKTENIDYKKILVELFEDVKLSHPRTIILQARRDDGTGLKPCSNYREQASLALGSLYGRTVYDVNAWMLPKESLFRGVNLTTYVTAAFGSVTIAKQAYKDIKSLFK